MADNPTTTVNNPAEMQDTLSSELLLVPDSEFILYRWAYSSLVASQMADEDGFDLAEMQLREGRLATGGEDSNIDQAMSSGMGGPLLLSMGMTYPDMVRMVAEAKLPGDNIKIDRPRFIDGATTEANRKLSGSAKIFGSTQPIVTDQVDVPILEYGGPGDANGNIVPVALAKFAQHRGKHNQLKQLGNELRRDRAKFWDDLAYTRLITAAAAVSDGTTRGEDEYASNANFTAQNNEPMTYNLLIKSTEKIQGRKVPGIAGQGKYVAILDIHQAAQLKMDPGIKGLAVFEPAWNALFPGYYRSIGDLIICVSNRVPRLANIGAGSALTGYQGIIVAPGALGWASAMGAKALRDRNDDGGRFSAFAWHAYEGVRCLDDRFVQLMITT